MNLLPSRRSLVFVFGCCCAAVIGAAGACQTQVSTGAKNAGSVGGSRPTKIEHQACDTSSKSAAKTDVNNDGRPDIVRVMAGGREVCRAVDLNFDGTVDNYLYFDEKGELKRRESAFSTSGLTDEIAVYKNGKIAEKYRETNLDQKLDTWDFYENDRLVRRERDTNADGRIDQVWTFPDPSKADCPVVETDRDGDGKPEQKQDICKEQEAAASAQALTNAPAPTEAPKASGSPATSAPAAASAPTASAPPSSTAAAPVESSEKAPAAPETKGKR